MLKVFSQEVHFGKENVEMKQSWLAVCVAVGFLYPAVASMELVSPVNGDTIQLLPEAQKQILAIPTYGGRLAALRADKEVKKTYFKDKSNKWRVSMPLTLKWKTTNGEKGPWKLVIGRKPDLSDAKPHWLESKQVAYENGDGFVLWTCQLERANLELGREYYWKVWSDVKCPEYDHGSTIGKSCCEKAKRSSESGIATFRSEDQAPRWIAIEGRVKNIRDLGGWRTHDGKRVKQGLVFRGEGLNDNSVNGERRGRNRLTVEDVRYFTEELGIRTDLDLRNKREISDLAKSPLGEKVAFVAHSSAAYAGIFDSHGKKVMAENIRLFCDEKNYPIYFHCIGGADRTGSLAYVLNGILGVERHDLETDWESTFYPMLPELESGYSGENYWRLEQHFNRGFEKYGTKETSWNDRIKLYLLDCGVKEEEITKIRSILLE